MANAARPAIAHPRTVRRQDGDRMLSRVVQALRRGRSFLVLGLIAYVPLLATRPGLINADTKQMLYLDPGRLVRNAPYLWDPSTGMGTVTHQNIGYLFPTGPFFWAGQLLGLPDWVTQRLWMGSLLLVAGAGMIMLWRTLGLRNDAAGLIAALTYQLSPYTLGYLTGTSVLLLPWAGLPVLMALTIRAGRRGGWRHPALIALVVTAVGAVNASSLFYVAIGTILWFPYAVWATKELTLRRALGTVARIGVLVCVTQLWWIMALLIGGRYGLPILHTTETVEQVSTTSSAPEILRGLGYWLFYVRDNGVLWWPFSERYTMRPVALGISLMVPLLALIAGSLTRWRHRILGAGLIAVGTVIATGAFPYENPSLLAKGYRSAAMGSDLILSLRNTQRATPLVVLGIALLLGTGLSALASHRPRTGAVATLLLGALVVANFSPLWTRDLLSDRLHRPERIPAYWEKAAAAIDAKSPATRVLELPGSDFAAYRWGNTLDPITPGLADRPSVSRELVPKGSAGTVSILTALDRRMQEGTLDAAGLAPMARLMNTGDVLARFDLEYERYRTPRPWLAWAFFSPPPPGLGSPQRFGPSTPPNRAAPSLPLIDEIALATEPGAEEPPRLALLPVQDPLPIIHSRPIDRLQTVDGDGEGVVEAAEVGLLDPDAALFYAGSLADDARLTTLANGSESDLILTDTNRRRAQRWFGLRENAGYTEYSGETSLREDPTDARIPLFPHETDSQTTVVIPRGGLRASATSYGDPLRLLPHERPSRAIDGNPDTAWITGGFSRVVGERIVVTLDRAVTPDHLTLLQPQGSRDRYITRARLTFDDRDPLDVELTDASRNLPGQRIDLSGRTFRRLGIEVLDDGLPPGSSYRGLDGVGLAEIGIDGVGVVDEVTRLPTSLLGSIDNDLDHRLAIVVARLRSNPREPVLRDTEEAMARSFTLPSDRRFALSGSARLSAQASDPMIDRLVGIPSATENGTTASSSGRLPGDLASRASAAIDGDAMTHWSPGFLGQVGHWVRFDLNAPQSFDRLNLQIVRDGRHSVPTRLRLDTDTGASREVLLPTPTGPLSPLDVPTAMTVTFQPLTAGTLTVTVLSAAAATTTDWYTQGPIDMPVAIAEIGIPGVQISEPDQALPPVCRHDLVTIDGMPYPVRVGGTSAHALERGELDVEPCSAEPLMLTKGEHEIRTAPGRLSGFDIDRLVMLSDRGGVAQTLDGWAASTPARRPVEDAPRLDVTTHSPTRRSIQVTPGGEETFWLVLGESHNDGWTARIPGVKPAPPRLIDGFANGWLVTAPKGGLPFAVELEWTPQQRAWQGIQASLIGVVVCLGILGWSFTRRRRHAGAAALPMVVDDERQPTLSFSWHDDTPSIKVVVLAMLALGVTGAVVAKPVVGIGVAVFVGIGLTWKRSRTPLGLAAYGSFGLSAAFIGIRQIRRHYPTDSNWPELFHAVHWLAVSAVLFLLAHAVVERLRSPGTTDRGDRADEQA